AEIAVAASEQFFQRDRSEAGGERGGREGVGREAMFGHPVAAREEDEDDGGGAAGEGDERGAARAAGDQRQRTGVERPVPGIGEEPVIEVPEAAVIPAALGEEGVGEPLGVVPAAEDEPEG